MDKKKWQNPRIPLSTLALKLAEEVGEVSTIITDAQFAGHGIYDGPLTKPEREHLIEELDHVRFIASQMKKRLR